MRNLPDFAQEALTLGLALRQSMPNPRAFDVAVKYANGLTCLSDINNTLCTLTPTDCAYWLADAIHSGGLIAEGIYINKRVRSAHERRGVKSLARARSLLGQ